jgi:hypothetical protein
MGRKGDIENGFDAGNMNGRHELRDDNSARDNSRTTAEIVKE